MFSSILPRIAYAERLWADVCTQPAVSSLPFCDMSRTADERAADYTTRIAKADPTGAQMGTMMHNAAAAFPPLHIPMYQWGSEGLHGPLQPCVCDTKACACPTDFPCPSAMGAAFNNTLYFKVGQADGREARAISNLRNHTTQNVYGDGIDYWSPTINLQRDPRWGRNQEVPGEDPILTGNYAANFVQGLQGSRDGLDANVAHVQIVATCKHYVANSLENWKGFSRHNFDAKVPAIDLYEYYLPPFRSCVMEGHAKGIMCSYNAVNGVPSCANDFLLNDTLRNSWGFEGYVTSDCGAINDICAAADHNYTHGNCAKATALSIVAGTDVDCGGVYGDSNHGIPAAIKNEGLAYEQVQKSFARLTKIQVELGLFDSNKNDAKKQPYWQLGLDTVGSAEHAQLALEAARQSIVLLKNDASTLPIAAKKGLKIVVVGAHYNATGVMMSNYQGSACLEAGQDPAHPPIKVSNDYTCIVSPLLAITRANHEGSTVGVQGCDVNSGRDDIASAVAAAKDADVVIIIAGIDDSLEREGLDRITIDLPGLQPKLVDAIAALKKRTVLVTMSGGTLSLGKRRNSPGLAAIVSAGYGGVHGGQALADVLFGHYNPSGKLAATVYPASFVDATPLTEMSVSVKPGRTHMFYEGEAEYVFGHGLSYTTFVLSWSTTAVPSLPSLFANTGASSHRFGVSVHNVGARDGARTVLVFWRPSAIPGLTDAHAALKQKLLYYDGAHLAATKVSTLYFTLNLDDLALADATGERAVLSGAYELVVRDGASELVHPFVVRGAARRVVKHRRRE
jgi:beta-glucosidase-like glycosyl hydrolase